MTLLCTVKPVYNSHPWDSKQVAVVPLFRGCLWKISIDLGLIRFGRSLLTGGFCSEVVVSTGLTLHVFS